MVAFAGSIVALMVTRSPTSIWIASWSRVIDSTGTSFEMTFMTQIEETPQAVAVIVVVPS